VGIEGEGQAIVKTVEMEGLRKNGEEFPIEMAPSKSDLEDETFYCGIIRDISERKQAERALKEQNHLLSFEAEVGDVLNQRQPLGIILHRCAETIARHLNVAWMGLWTLDNQQEGLTLQAHGGICCPTAGLEDLKKFGHFEIGQIAYEKRPLLTNAAFECPGVPEQAWAKREGLVAFVGYPLLSKQEVVGVMAMFSREPLPSFTLHSLFIVADRIATAIDRHRVIEVHQNLARYNERILASSGEGIYLARYNERILASSGEGIYGLDVEGKLTFVNPAGAQMLGYHMEELLGEPMHELIHHTRYDGSPYPREDCPLNAAIQEGAVYRNDTEMLWRKDGTSFPVDYSISPIVEDGQRTGAVVTFQDISERIQLTAELLEETKLAGVTLMLGDIAHDIKNMLMPVLNGAKLLEDDLQELFVKLPDVTSKELSASRKFTRDAVDMIVKNARRIQGRMREIADTVKGITSPIRFQGLDALPSIQADENRLFNALYNLVNNAIPETPVGGSVTLGGSVGADGKTVVLTVTDTGGGMPSEIRDRLFTKEAISGKAGGTGLGTKIVKDVVDAHGGNITVESEPGKGTSFHITLPVEGPATRTLSTLAPGVEEGRMAS
jgi:PAS domain S-box-containing protein